MSNWTPEWRIKIDGETVTGVTLANLTITSGRTDIYQQPVAGYCNLQLINYDETIYPFNVGTGVSVEVKNTSGTFLPIFGGYITDYGIKVQSAGSVAFTTVLSLTAVGALSKLPKILDNGVLTKDYEGDQIYDLLSGYLLGQWSEVPGAQTWATYDATETWANAVNLGLGEIDRPGNYEMVARSSSQSNLYALVTQIAKSGFGYIFEDANGNIGYADSTHRQDYLTLNGYVTLDANTALASGISTSTKSGDIRNKYTVTYGNNGSGSHTAENAQSQSLYGIYGESFASSIHGSTDAQILADRFVELRAFPSAKFESITFPLGSPEIGNTERDALLGIFMGMPVDIQNLPANMEDSFQGFVEGWTFRASYNGLSITFNASNIAYSLTANKWENVIASERWNTLSGTMDWLNATVVA